MRRCGVRFLLRCFCARLCCTSLPWHRYFQPQTRQEEEEEKKKELAPNTRRRRVSVCQSPLISAATIVRYFHTIGQCHFPLCMWIIEIRLSTVIVHCVETSVIVNQNVLRDFTTQEIKKAEQMNDWLQEKDKNMTQHERAFIVLCIYAIVYVWIWRIWKYMLTNLYRVFYVMWNTWSRCSLLSLSLSLLFLLSLSFLLSCSPLSSLLLKTEHIRRTRLLWVMAFWTCKACSYLRRWIWLENAVWVNLWWQRKTFCCSFLLIKA